MTVKITKMAIQDSHPYENIIWNIAQLPNIRKKNAQSPKYYFFFNFNP